MHIPYGATLNVKDGQKVNKGDIICTWDPFNNVIVAETNGIVHFESLIEGITYRDEADEQTGHREKVVIETKDKTKLPTIIVEGKEKKITKNPKQSSLNEKKIISCLLKKQAGRDIKFQIRSLSITFLYILAWNP